MAEGDMEIRKAVVKIKVIGVGGGGNNVLMRIAGKNYLDIELIAINTDASQLGTMQNIGVNTLQIGAGITKGRGTGGQMQIGEAAALADEEKIKSAISGADLVFVTAGMGGGVGTGAAPVVARFAKELGILTIGVVTVPFSFEGSRKKRIANEGIIRMRAHMDALIDVHNDNLLKLQENKKITMIQAFDMADGILKQAIRCISELILTIGVINVDFADVKSIFQQSESSDALIGIGESSRGAIEAVQRAVESPLIEKSLVGARGIILNLSGNANMSLYEVNEATKYIYENTHPDVNIILGTVVDEELGDRVKATIIATDFVNGTVLKEKAAKEQDKDTNVSGAFGIGTPEFMKPQTRCGVPQFKPVSELCVPSFKPRMK